MSNKYEESYVALSCYFPSSSQWKVRDLHEALKKIVNGRDFAGVAHEGLLAINDVVQLLADDRFAERVIKVVEVVEHNTTPETIAAARFALCAMRAEQKGAELEAATRKLLEAEEKKELEAVQPSYATEISDIVNRVTAPYQHIDDNQPHKGDDNDQQ